MNFPSGQRNNSGFDSNGSERTAGQGNPTQLVLPAGAPRTQPAAIMQQARTDIELSVRQFRWLPGNLRMPRPGVARPFDREQHEVRSTP